MRNIMGVRTPIKSQSVVTTSPLVTNLGGEATAIGENTLATGTVDSKITDKGAVTKAKGTVTASATVQSANDDLTYTTAYTYAEIDGADHFKTKTKTTYTYSESNGEKTVTETSVTKFHAIAKEPEKGAKISEYHTVQDDTGDAASWYAGGAIDGNVAAVSIDAQAYGENSYVGVETSVLAVEDQLSTVNFSVITAVD